MLSDSGDLEIKNNLGSITGTLAGAGPITGTLAETGHLIDRDSGIITGIITGTINGSITGTIKGTITGIGTITKIGALTGKGVIAGTLTGKSAEFQGITLQELRKIPGLLIPTKIDTVILNVDELKISFEEFRVLAFEERQEKIQQYNNDARLEKESAVVKNIKFYDQGTRDFITNHWFLVSDSFPELIGSDFGTWEVTKVERYYYGCGRDHDSTSELNIKFSTIEPKEVISWNVSSNNLLVNLAYYYGDKIYGIASLYDKSEENILKFLAHIPFNDQGQVCKYSVGEWALTSASLDLEELSALTGLSRAYIKIVASYLGPDDIKSEGAITDTHTAQLGTGNDEVQLRGADAHYGDGMTFGPAAEE